MTTKYPVPAQPRTEPATLIQAAQHLLVAQTLRSYGGSADLVLLGDSITQGWQWNPSWGNHIAAGRKVLNFGLGGDGIPHLLWRLEQGQVDKLQVPHAMLLIGVNSLWVNSTAEELADGIGMCLERTRRGLPDASILLYGIFPVRNSSPVPLQTIREINKLLPDVASRHGADFHDIGDRFRIGDDPAPASMMPDGTHLSNAAYEIWSQDLLGWLASVKAENCDPLH